MQSPLLPCFAAPIYVFFSVQCWQLLHFAILIILKEHVNEGQISVSKKLLFRQTNTQHSIVTSSTCLCLFRHRWTGLLGPWPIWSRHKTQRLTIIMITMRPMAKNWSKKNHLTRLNHWFDYWYQLSEYQNLLLWNNCFYLFLFLFSSFLPCFLL